MSFKTLKQMVQFIRMMKTNNIQKLKYTKKYVRFPKFEMIHRMRIGGIPKRIMLINMFATAIYTAGVLSALYASFLNPDYATNASTASGLVNGFATILLTVLLRSTYSTFNRTCFTIRKWR